LTDLLDINVWVGLAAENHPFHEAALNYWQSEAAAKLALCSVTATGFVRILTRPHGASSQALPLEEAWRLYSAWRQSPEVVFLHQPAACDSELDELVSSNLVTPRLWNDAYLAAFAKSAGLRLVTFDRDFQRFPGLDLLLLEA
jgi:toxin-antitoxin system PIN domain toxin